MTRLALIATSLGAALGVAALAQQQTPAQRPPVFRGSSVLVTVDAYPQRDGRIVEGLTAADFEILEDGKPQAVEEVEFVRVEAPLAESARRDPNNEAEARALAADPRNRVFIVFLDAQQTSLQGSHAIRQPLIDTLNRVMAPTDLFGVMTPNLDPRYLVLGRRLLGIEEQLAKYWPWGQRGRITTDPNSPIEEELFNCFKTYQDPKTGEIKEWLVEEDGRMRLLYKVLVDRNREDRTLTSIEKMVDHLAGLREARTVVLLVSDGLLLYPPDQGLANESARQKGGTPGIVIGRGGQMGLSRGTDGGNDRVQCNAELLRLASLDHPRRFRDLMTRANRHNVTFYPVAPTGLSTFDVSPTTEQLDRGETGISQSRSMERHTSRLEALRTVADNTDGIAIVNTNDLSTGLKRVVDDVSAYYLIRYYSTNTQNDGGFRRIGVKVRQPGLQVRARRGYLAPSPAPAATEAPKPKLVPSVDVTDALATLSKAGSAPELFTRGVVEGPELWIAIEIPSSQANEPAWRDGAIVNLTVTEGTGQPVAALGRIDAVTRGTLVRVPLSEQGKGPWRVISRVTGGGAMLQDRLEVRAAPAELLGPPMFYRSQSAASSPLRPVADYQYRRTERARVEWRLSEPVDNRSARLLGRDGRPLPIPVNLTEQTKDGRSVLAADVSLSPLSPGDYVIEVAVGRGARSFRTLVAIRIVP